MTAKVLAVHVVGTDTAVPTVVEQFLELPRFDAKAVADAYACYMAAVGHREDYADYVLNREQSLMAETPHRIVIRQRSRVVTYVRLS